jgi:hypothetical protein
MKIGDSNLWQTIQATAGSHGYKSSGREERR